MNEISDSLKQRFATIADLDAASAVLSWDQQTHMPEGGLAARAEQLSTLSRISHDMLVSEETGALLEETGNPDPISVEGAFLRVARREYERAARLPSRLVGELSRTRSLAQGAWEKARANSDWELFAPHLERMVALQREAAEHLGYEEHPYDALLDAYEPGMRKSQLDELFARLREELVPIVKKLPREATGEEPFRGSFDEGKQEEFSTRVITDFGYDWSRGRQDRVTHPFCTSLGGPADVRITTRFDPTWFSYHFFATLHEAGHALYEQGVDPAYTRTPLAGGASLGMHESQSRLWENIVGRSREFWNHYQPLFGKTFPQAAGASAEDLYRAANVAYPSEIRTEADELTYNLHILIRYEIETALLEGDLEVSGLPGVWNEKTKSYLGFVPPSASRGVLQDVHWAMGLIGYFPTYTLGNVLSAQIFEAAESAHPEIREQISEGRFETLLGWLRENIHRHGRRYEPRELIERATGRPMESGPYVSYLKRKYGEIYDL